MLTVILAIAAASAGMQPPALPRPALLAELGTTDCADAGQRRRLIENGERAMQVAGPELQRASGRFEARMNAHADRLIALRVWTAADRTRFARELLDRPDFKAYLEEAAGVMTSMMQSLDTIMAAPADEERSCRALVSMIGQIDRSVTVGERGWALLDRAFGEEARRLGVTLD